MYNLLLTQLIIRCQRVRAAKWVLIYFFFIGFSLPVSVFFKSSQTNFLWWSFSFFLFFISLSLVNQRPILYLFIRLIFFLYVLHTLASIVRALQIHTSFQLYDLMEGNFILCCVVQVNRKMNGKMGIRQNGIRDVFCQSGHEQCSQHQPQRGLFHARPADGHWSLQTGFQSLCKCTSSGYPVVHDPEHWLLLPSVKISLT